jgi:hypothetical protein
MLGRYQVTPWWCLSLLAPGIALILILDKESLNTFQIPTNLPIVAGFLTASIHFIIFFFLFDSPPTICSGSSFLSAFPLAPTYVLLVLPIIPDALGIIINLLNIDSDFAVVFASSCFYGLAGGLLVSRKLTYRSIGLTLVGTSFLIGFFSILVAIGTGCGA